LCHNGLGVPLKFYHRSKEEAHLKILGKLSMFQCGRRAHIDDSHMAGVYCRFLGTDVFHPFFGWLGSILHYINESSKTF
jgi:hypothetical protein